MTAGAVSRPAGSCVMHVRCPDRMAGDTYREVLELLGELFSVVQALPPSAALVELRGALRYHGATAAHLGDVLRLRTVSHLGIDVRVGIGPTVTVATTASAQVPHPGGVLAIDAADVTDWLALLPVEELHGIGPRHAATLKRYGIDRVGLLAALPPATVQRMLGEDRPHGRRPGTRYRSPHRHPTPPARLSGRSPPLPPRRPRRRRCRCGSARSGRAAGCRAALPRAGCPRPHAHVVVRRRTEVGEDAPSDRAVRARGRSASARLPGDGRGGAPAGPADRTRAARRGPGRRRPGRRAAQPRCRAAGASGGGVGRRPDPEAIRAGRDRPGRHLGPTPR